MLALQEQGLTGAGWVLQVLEWAGCVPQAVAACKKDWFSPFFSVGAAQVLWMAKSPSRTRQTKGIYPINPCLCRSGEGSRKAFARQRDGNVLQLTEQAPGLWQENIAQDDLSGAPFESQGGDCFWTVTFSRLTKDSPGAVQAASDGLSLPQALSAACTLHGHSIHPEKHQQGFPALSSSFARA